MTIRESTELWEKTVLKSVCMPAAEIPEAVTGKNPSVISGRCTRGTATASCTVNRSGD